ncbi:MAG: hypothetical protein EA369_05975 [Bradymonadales bacterium]|nr:MAG: hypothetical protein EA369_05975 [Bradymonadales bacterium]
MGNGAFVKGEWGLINRYNVFRFRGLSKNLRACLIWLLVFQFLWTPSFSLHAKDPRQPNLLEAMHRLTGTDQTTDDLGLEPAELEARLKAHFEIIGRDPAEAATDPYYAGSQSLQVTRGNETQSFDLMSPNLDAPEPPLNYRLDRDVEAFWNDRGLSLRLRQINGRPLRGNLEFTHHFEITGISQVIKDSGFVYLLMKNGDILCVLMAHSWLFRANLRAQGGPLLVAYVGSVDRDLLLNQLLVPEGLRIEFFDRVRAQAWDQAEIPQKAWDDLHYGDLVILDRDRHVQQSISLKSISSLLGFHVGLLELRHKLVSFGLSPLRGATEAMLTEDMLRATPGFQEAMQRLFGDESLLDRISSWTGMAEHTGVIASDWIESPTENRPLASARLQEEKALVTAFQALSLDPGSRSTYNHSTQPTNSDEVLNTIERKISRLIRDAAGIENEEPKRSVWQRLASLTRISLKNPETGKAYSLGKKATALGLAGMGSALALGTSYAIDPAIPSALLYETGEFLGGFLNMIINLLPQSHVFLHPSHQVKLFDLGFVEGPEVSYIGKFVGLSLALGAVIALLPKFVFAHFDEKVTGTRLAKNNFNEASIAGIGVYYTVMLRLVSRLLKSKRESLAKLLGQSDMLEASKMGIPPPIYWRHGGGRRADAVSLQAKFQRASVLVSKLTLELLLVEIIKQGIASPSASLDWFFVRKQIIEKSGERAFTNFEKRASLLSFRIWQSLEQKILLLNGHEEASQWEELENEIRKNLYVRESIQDLRADLTKFEIKELKRAEDLRSHREIAARWAGQNHLYHRFRSGVVPENVVREAIGWNSFIDFTTTLPFAGFTLAFSDLENPEMLAVGDESLIGVGSSKLFSEGLMNVGMWAAHTPHEVLVWAREAATSIVGAYINPQLLAEDGKSDIRKALQTSRRLTGQEMRQRYWSGYSGLNLLYGIQKTGEKITIAEIKGLKVLMTIGVAVTFAGYMLDLDYAAYGLDQMQSLAETAYTAANLGIVMAWDSVVKVLFSSVLAYSTYRPLWFFHNLGLRVSDGFVNDDMKSYADLLTSYSAELVGHQDAMEFQNLELIAHHRENLLKKVEAIQNIYRHHAAPLPSRFAADFSELPDEALQDECKAFLEHNLKEPPTPMRTHGLKKVGYTWGMGVVTTIVALQVFGFAWGAASELEPTTLGAFLGALYAGGKALKYMGRRLRSKFGYLKSLDALKIQLEELHFHRENLSPESREDLYRQILSVVDLYRHYETKIPASIVNLERLNPDRSNLFEIATDLYFYILENPPMDPSKFGYGQVAKSLRKHVDALATHSFLRDHPRAAQLSSERAISDLEAEWPAKRSPGFVERCLDLVGRVGTGPAPR